MREAPRSSVISHLGSARNISKLRILAILIPRPCRVKLAMVFPLGPLLRLAMLQERRPPRPREPAGHDIADRPRRFAHRRVACGSRDELGMENQIGSLTKLFSFQTHGKKIATRPLAKDTNLRTAKKEPGESLHARRWEGAMLESGATEAWNRFGLELHPVSTSRPSTSAFADSSFYSGENWRKPLFSKSPLASNS